MVNQMLRAVATGFAGLWSMGMRDRTAGQYCYRLMILMIA